MGWKNIYCSKDTWISNKINTYLRKPSVRITGSNFGRSPTLRIFKLSGSDFPNTKVELARILMQFDITKLSQSIFIDQTIPSSSANYKLKMFNMEHESEVPSSYDIVCYPLTRSWDERKSELMMIIIKI